MSGQTNSGAGRIQELGFTPAKVPDVHPIPLRAFAHGAAGIYDQARIAKRDVLDTPYGEVRYNFTYNPYNFSEQTSMVHDADRRISRLWRRAAPLEVLNGMEISLPERGRIYRGPITRAMRQIAPLALSGATEIPPELADTLHMVAQPTAAGERPLPPILSYFDPRTRATLVYQPLEQIKANRRFREVLVTAGVQLELEVGQDPMQLPEVFGVIEGETRVELHHDFIPQPR